MAYGSVNVPGAMPHKQDALTGLPGQVLRFDGMGLPYAAEGWSNRNLIINWDFRRPVNRQGRAEYVGAGYAIDRYRLSSNEAKLSVEDGFVRYEAVSTPESGPLLHQRSKFSSGESTEMTLSVLSRCSGFTADNQVRFGVRYSTDGKTYTNLKVGYHNCMNDDWNMNVITVIVPSSAKYIQADIAQLMGAAGADVGCYVDLYAAKLELGDHQTLARQNEDGEWEIIDPPDYDLQYALCSLYSPITGAFAGSRYSNDNLLDNGRFTINQRAQKSYTGGVYGVDRWKSNNAGLTVTINDDETITLTNGGTSTAYYRQTFETPLDPDDYTLSALVTASDPKSGHNTMYHCYDDNTFSQSVQLDSPGLHSVTSAREVGKNIFRVQYNIAPGGSLSLRAAKLELGLVQTLAHQDADGNWVLNDPPPNKALELAKCQRYQIFGEIRGYKVWTYDAPHKIGIFFPLPTTMRATPTLIGDVTYAKSGENTEHPIPIKNITLCSNGVYMYINSSGVDFTDITSFAIGAGNGLDANL